MRLPGLEIETSEVGSISPVSRLVCGADHTIFKERSNFFLFCKLDFGGLG
ncbi:hypothetical protein Csa_017614 [Cucumis sativus]|uniref:Uncharacterized protein n=1 Tax=Cucumis sativus TaxID=3659 RepID=A0A0A0L8H8_CUCSA|nr:hypothetical protein Csa_017614 [Cucumis sativus]